jgi:hypothetical protein
MPARVGWLALLAAATAAAQIPSTPVGHEYREDDLPAIAAAPDGSLWVVWLSFAGSRDDVAIRRYDGVRWSNVLCLSQTPYAAESAPAETDRGSKARGKPTVRLPRPDCATPLAPRICRW